MLAQLPQHLDRGPVRVRAAAAVQTLRHQPARQVRLVDEVHDLRGPFVQPGPFVLVRLEHHQRHQGPVVREVVDQPSHEIEDRIGRLDLRSAPPDLFPHSRRPPVVAPRS
jgi:hypothetical protein